MAAAVLFSVSSNMILHHFVVDQAHTGLVDLFVTHFRKELEKAPREKKPSVLKKLQNPLPDTAPKPGREKAQEL